MIKFLGKHKIILFSILLILIILSLIIFMLINLIPLLVNVVAHVMNEEKIASMISNFGIRGVLVLISLQALQIVTVIFPTVAIEILAGLTYGIFYGLLICQAGYMLGNTMIFVLVRQLEKTFNHTDHKHKKKLRKSKWDFSFISKSDNATLMAFFLFLIPGIPNGILPYIFAKTKITLPRYLLCIMVAGTPTILLSSMVGARIAKGDIYTAVIISGILLFISLLAFFMRSHIIAFLKKHSK